MPEFESTPEWPLVLDDSELETLDQFLRAHADEEALLLDGVHGLLSAIGIGPDPALPDEWLSEVLHDPFADAQEGEAMLALLARLNESIDIELDANLYEPILGEIELDDGDSALSAQGWCEGFSRGVDLRAGLWEARLATDSQLTELLSPIMALAVEEGVFESDFEFAPLNEQEYDECLAHLPCAVSAVAHYWRENPPTPEERASCAPRTDAQRERHRRRGKRWLH